MLYVYCEISFVYLLKDLHCINAVDLLKDLYFTPTKIINVYPT